VPFDDNARVIAGARTVAPHVPAIAARALALRMPEPLGRRVWAAWIAFARADASRGASWIALAA
jgi:hypothetical protein